MVSAFMSFATGALQEVGKQIDKYQAQEYQQEQLEAAADREDNKMRLANNLEGDLRRDLLKREQKLSDQEKLERLRFGFREKEIKMEQTFKEGESKKERTQTATLSANELKARKQIAGLKTKLDKAKNYNTVGTDKSALSWRRDKTNRDEEVKNLFTAINADEDRFNAVMNNAETSDAMKAELKNAFSTIVSGVGSFSAKKQMTPGGTETEITPRPHLRQQLQILGVKNKKVLKFAEQYMRDPVSMGVNPGSDAAAVTMRGGRAVVVNENEIPGIDKAVERWKKSHYGSKLKNRAEIVADMSNALGQMSEERKAVYFKAYNGALGAVLTGETEPDSPQFKAAQDFLYDKRNGFIDDKGQLKVSDLKKLAETFGRANAQGEAPQGFIAQQIKFREINKGDVQKDVVSTRELGSTGLAARKTIRRLIELQGVSESSSDLIDSVRVAKLGLPEIIRDGRQIVAELIAPNRQLGLSRNQFVDSVGNVSARFSKRALQRFNKEMDNSLAIQASGNERDIASAQIKMNQLILAYQITGILQGGTGGRTISDQDITRTLAMFSGTLGSNGTRVQKLRRLESLVQKAIDKQEIYSYLKDGQNADSYTVAKRANSLIKSEYTLGNFDVRINASVNTAVAVRKSERVSDIVSTIAQKRLMGADFNRNLVFDGISNVIPAGGTAQLYLDKLVFNSVAADEWRQAVEASKTSKGKLATVSKRELINIRKRLERTNSNAFYLPTGKMEKVTYDADGTFSIDPPDDIENEERSRIVPEEAMPNFASLGNKLFTAA